MKWFAKGPTRAYYYPLDRTHPDRKKDWGCEELKAYTNGHIPDDAVCVERWISGVKKSIIEKRSQTSCHYAVDGGPIGENIIQGVMEKDIAYTSNNLNPVQVGIEMCGNPKKGPGQGALGKYAKMYNENMLEATAQLVANICIRNNIVPIRDYTNPLNGTIIGHEDYRAEKFDPGTRYGSKYWDWEDFMSRVMKYYSVN